MLFTVAEATALIESGELYHICGCPKLLRILPKGNWIGGTIQHFMTAKGGVVDSERVFITKLEFNNFNLVTYDENDIMTVTNDSYNNGFSLIVLPHNSNVYSQYSKCACDIDNIYMNNMVGWACGPCGDFPATVFNGLTGEASSDKALVLHVELPADKIANIGIINIFEPDESSPTIEFLAETNRIGDCLVDGKRTVLSQYMIENNRKLGLPLVGDYSGVNLNVSLDRIVDGEIIVSGHVFPDIEYRFSKEITNYVAAFEEKISELECVEPLFACNCMLNFMHGELEGKLIKPFYGPMTYGEIAFHFLTQTLVYLVIVKRK